MDFGNLSIFDVMKWLHEHGIWEALNFLLIVGGLSIWGKLAFFPRRRIRNLNFYMRLERNEEAQFPLSIHLQIRNYTGRTVVLSNPLLHYRHLRAPPEAHRDSPSGDIEIKFFDQTSKAYSEVEVLLRNKEIVNTLIPIDPAHSNAEVQKAIDQKRLGRLTMTCIWIQEKPQVVAYRPSL